MRRHKLMLLVSVAVLFLASITGCKTCPEPISYTLPSDLPVPALLNTDDPIDIERDYVTLIAQDLRWRMRMAASRLIVGEITAEEYSIVVDDILSRLDDNMSEEE